MNLSSTTSHKHLLDADISYKRYDLNKIFEYSISKLIALATQNDSFILKINIFVLFCAVLESTENESPIEVIPKFTISDLIQKIEEMLSVDFKKPLGNIYSEISKNGFNKNEFIKLFKLKNQVGLHEFRQTKKMEFALKLVKKSYKIKEVSELTGFESDSRFTEFFKKNSGGYTPLNFRKMDNN